jgi:hypothetical protein
MRRNFFNFVLCQTSQPGLRGRMARTAVLQRRRPFSALWLLVWAHSSRLSKAELGAVEELIREFEEQQQAVSA